MENIPEAGAHQEIEVNKRCKIEKFSNICATNVQQSRRRRTTYLPFKSRPIAKAIQMHRVADENIMIVL